MRTRCLVVAIVTVALGVASPASGSSARAFGGVDDPIDWRRCTKAEMPSDPDVRAQMQCAEVEVPVDHSDPDGRTIQLFVSRRRSSAPDPLGPLFVNQGGPGKEAAVYAAAVSAYPAFDRFDIIGMDPRGAGRSTALECSTDIRDLPPFATPEEGRAARRYVRGVERFVAGCADDPNLPFLGTNNAARDMDLIRERLGAEQLTYLGKSYGSDLGAAYATLFPSRVRAAILDGGTDFSVDPVDFVIQQATAGQRALARYLEHCRSATCAWTEGDDPQVAWDRLVAAADDEPIRSDEGEGSVDGATLRDFGSGLFALEPAEATALLDALVLARDPSALLEEAPSDDDAKDAIAFLAVTCLDLPVDDFGAAATRLLESVPAASPNEASVLALCAEWPKPADPIVVTPGERGPMAVVSTVGDVPTPYESGVALARSLGVPVITWDAHAHTAYVFSECVQSVANALLVDLVPVPPDGVTCPDDRLRAELPEGLHPDDLDADELEPDLTL